MSALLCLPPPAKPIFPAQPGYRELLAESLRLCQQHHLHGAATTARAAIETWIVNSMPGLRKGYRFYGTASAIYRNHVIDRETFKKLKSHFAVLSDWIHLGIPNSQTVCLRITKIAHLLATAERRVCA
jgi:hypothetical protein